MISKEQSAQLTEALGKVLSNTYKCIICSGNNFEIHEGYFVNTVQNDFQNLKLGGDIVPYAMMSCKKCGNIQSFAMKTLGLV